MRLTSEQIDNFKSKLKKATLNDITVFPNGLFEITVNKSEKLDDIVGKVKKLPFIWDAMVFFAHDSDSPNVVKGLLKETAKEGLEEAVEIHDTLNPKIWTEEELKPEVKEKILAIVQKFKELLALDKVDLKIEDIYLLGSNANYNYNEDSDLDIHIIADESFDCSEEHLGIIYNAYKTLFNNKYDITIKGINVEIYVENKAALTNVSSGIYSLNNGWIKKPAVYDIPEIDQLSVDKQVQIWEDRYYSVTENPSMTKIDDYLDSIYDMRQNSIKKEGEFGEGNLVFKEIRRRGYLNNLRDLKVDLTSKELSLEGLDEDVEKEIKIQDNDNIIEDEKELDPPIDLEYFPNKMGINLNSVKSEKWVEQDDGQLKKVEIEFDPATKKVNEEAKQKIKYKYFGPIYVDLVKYDWEDETYAVSQAQARSNILWKAKETFGTNRVELPRGDEFWTEEKEEEVFTPSTAKCKHCGTLLTTSGECPVCDLGDETALEEKCNKN